MFKKTVKELQKLTINNIISVDGYQAGVDGNMYIAQVENLVLVVGMNPKKPMQGVKALAATAKLPMGSDAEKKYGNRIILVDKKFSRLPKKQRLALIEIENQKLRQWDTRFTSNTDGNEIVSTNLDRTITAELVAMEKFGYRHVKRAVMKNGRLMLKTEKPIGKMLYKNFKKQVKTNGNKAVEKVETPVTLQNA